MKERMVLISAIILTLIVELILMVLVYNKVGSERIPSQIVRLTIQLILITMILTRKSNVALFLLTTYHIVSSLFGLYSKGSTELLGQILIGFHFIIGIIIYFHDWIENKIGLKNIEYSRLLQLLGQFARSTRVSENSMRSFVLVIFYYKFTQL